MIQKKIYTIIFSLTLLFAFETSGIGSVHIMKWKDVVFVTISDDANNYETARSLFSALSTGELPYYSDGVETFHGSDDDLSIHCHWRLGEPSTRYTECVLVIGIRDKTVIDDESQTHRLVQTALEHNTSKEFYNKLLLEEEKKEETLVVKKFNSKDGLFKILCAKNPKEGDPCEDHPFLCSSKYPLCLLEARELKKD